MIQVDLRTRGPGWVPFVWVEGPVETLAPKIPRLVAVGARVRIVQATPEEALLAGRVAGQERRRIASITSRGER